MMPKEFNLKQKGMKRHGLSGHPLHRTWRGIRQRCLNPTDSHYRYYGARGIKICDRWLNSFVKFIDDMGPRPNGYSIDRIDNDGDYSPDNCRWADPIAQSRNQTGRMVEIDGTKRPFAEWCEITGISRVTAAKRTSYGWCKACAVTIPIRSGTCTHKHL